MRLLTPVIEVRELPPSLSRVRQDLPSLRDLVRETPSPFESAIVDYLLRGEVCVVFPDKGYGIDRVTPRRIRDACRDDPRLAGTDRAMGVWLTDGTWIWDGVLPYYVAAYHLRLPEPFVRFAQERGWTIDPEAITVEDLDPSAYDAPSGLPTPSASATRLT